MMQPKGWASGAVSWGCHRARLEHRWLLVLLTERPEETGLAGLDLKAETRALFTFCETNLAEKGGQAYADKNGVAIFPHLAVVDPFSQEILVKSEVFSLENLAIAMAAAVLDLEQEESRTLKKLSSKTSSDQWNVPVINVICTQDTGKKPLLVVTLAGSCALQPPYFVRRLDRILCDDQVVSTIKGRLDIQFHRPKSKDTSIQIRDNNSGQILFKISEPPETPEQFLGDLEKHILGFASQQSRRVRVPQLSMGQPRFREDPKRELYWQASIFSKYISLAARRNRMLLVCLHAADCDLWPDKRFWEDPNVTSLLNDRLILWTGCPTYSSWHSYCYYYFDRTRKELPMRDLMPHLAIVDPRNKTRHVFSTFSECEAWGPTPSPDEFCRQARTFLESFVHHSPKNSTSILSFDPPTHLSHRATNFSELLTRCKTSKRWLIVNIQDDGLPSLTLNAEIWRHPVIDSLILEGFIFWQTCVDFPGGEWYTNRYTVESFPHVAIFEADSGEIVWKKEGWTWEKRLTVEHFAEVMVSLDKRKSRRHCSGDASVVGTISSAATEAGASSWECLSLCDAWERLSMGRDDASTLGSEGWDEEEWEIVDSPTHLLHCAATFQEVLDDARDANRRLIVNVQDDSPSCRALNLDIWRDSRVESLVLEGFYLWQQPAASDEAKAYCKRHNVDEFPHVAIFDSDRIVWRRDGWNWTVDEPWSADMFVEKLKESVHVE